MIENLRATRKLFLTFEADDRHITKWWIDTALAAHGYMKSQKGGAMTLGIRTVYRSSVRQEINTRSFTETNLVNASDFILPISCIKTLLKAQRYKAYEDVIY